MRVLVTIDQCKQLKEHSKEAVQWLEKYHPDCPYSQYLGSLDFVLETTLALYERLQESQL
jgi:hypothetical protein